MSDRFWTEKELNERLVVAFSQIAEALKGLHEEAIKAGTRFWPDPREQRQAVVSHVPNEEDEAKRNLGVSDGPIDEWLNLGDPDEFIGEREREWRRTHPPETKEVKIGDASAEIKLFGAKDEPSTETLKGKTGSVGDMPTDHPAPKKRPKGRSKGGS
jgi:hypothetical protein